MKNRHWPALGLLVLLAQPAQAQPTLRVTVTLVQIDAVVTDATGRHVMDLGRDDFELLQDGAPQKITFFTKVDGPPPAPAPPPALTGVAAPIAPTGLTSAAQVKRTIALVVDDLALDFSDLVRTRDALRRYVTLRMQPGDLVAIIRTGGGLAMLEQFTTDKRILLEAIDALKWRFSGRQGFLPIAPPPNAGTTGSPAPNESTTASPPPNAVSHLDPQDSAYVASALGALGTIQQVVAGMRALPGRKSVVLLSDDLRAGPQIQLAIDHLTDMANRSAVSLYAVDPGGVRSFRRGDDEAEVVRVTQGPDGATLQTFPKFPGSEADDDSFRLAGLELLSTRTGGIFFHDRNDIDGAIANAADDQAGYYLLGYSPPEDTFAAQRKFHRLTVKVKRPGLKVRWKSGFDGVPDELIDDTASFGGTREQQLMNALASPFAATGLKTRLTSLFTVSPTLGPIVYSMLHFDANDVFFERELAGGWRCRLDLVWTAFYGVTRPFRQGDQPRDLVFSDEQYEKVRREGIVVAFSLRAEQPGAFLLRAVVRDSRSQRIGSASQFVQVPDTSKGKFAMSSVSIGLASKETLERQGVQVAANYEKWSQGGPAVRRYKPGQAILYGFQIFHAKEKGSNKATAVSSYIRVFRDGRLIYTGPEIAQSARSTKDPKNLVGGGVVRLGPALVPGEYLLQIVVTDRNASKKTRPQTQWIDFEVTRG